MSARDWLSDKDIEEYARFGFGIRDESAEHHWRNLDNNFSFLGKKSILILPGSGTTSAESANGMCKVVENMLPEELRKEWQICSLHYTTSVTMTEPTVIRAQKLFDSYFVPLFAVKNSEGNLEKLSVQEAARNVRSSLVVVTHCYGSDIMRAVEEQFDKTLHDIGYSAEEGDFIQKQLFVFQHNNVDEMLGAHKSAKTSNLIRISVEDEESYAGDMLLGTFRHYIQTREIDENKVFLLKLAANELVTLVQRVTKYGEKEHNGGYWLSERQKSVAGKLEEKVYNEIFKEVVCSDYLIEKPEQIINNILRREPAIKEILFSAIRSGKEFNRGYNNYHLSYTETFEELKQKILQGDCRKEDVLRADKEICFVESEEAKFLLDYALKQKNYDLAVVLFEQMKDKIRDPDDCGFMNVKSRNEIDACDKVSLWCQTALYDGNMAFFNEVSGKVADLWALDYNRTDIKTLAGIIDKVYNPETYPLRAYDEKEYMVQLAKIYAKSEKVTNSEASEKVKKTLENILFGDEVTVSYAAHYKLLEECKKRHLDRLGGLVQQKISMFPGYHKDVFSR